jgi:hypothetical protein
MPNDKTGTTAKEKINEGLLAETIRQLIPLAEVGARRAVDAEGFFVCMFAEKTLLKWCHEEVTRQAMLGGPIPHVGEMSDEWLKKALKKPQYRRTNKPVRGNTL